ncbi:MAG TPA: hypothetical protein VHE81_13565 [Lacipirellulaceae bacterium]|nr:hypothetical protein [Lacipirellulaceae bacterium]
MSHEHTHSEHEHHGHQPTRKRPIHHKWWFWAAIVLMLGAMVIYVMSQDEALGPATSGQQIPAATP